MARGHSGLKAVTGLLFGFIYPGARKESRIKF